MKRKTASATMEGMQDFGSYFSDTPVGKAPSKS